MPPFFRHPASLEHDTGHGHPERADRIRAIEAELESREWLGWEPRIQLADGLVLTVEYFKSRLARRNQAAISKIDKSGASPGMLD